MLSKTKIKLIQSLNRKKDRDETGLFLVEGNKMVEEALRSDFKVVTLIGTSTFLGAHQSELKEVSEVIETSKELIDRASLLQNPQESIAIVEKPVSTGINLNLNSKLYLALDFIQDPGNLGTIIRIADWFGIDSIICSENTVDVFNPKVVQATMGAIFRVKSLYINLEETLTEFSGKQIPVYGTFMNGENIYTESLSRNGIVVMGNEGNGISDSISRLVTRRITIPTFTHNAEKSESLNVAIATSICCSEFRRRFPN
jgi:rRNA methylases